MANKETIQLETQIEVPTAREQVTRKTLLELPEVSVENIPGWSEHVGACNRLAAAEALVRDAEKAMRESSKQMRAYIAKNWKPEEVNETVRAVLTSW